MLMNAPSGESRNPSGKLRNLSEYYNHIVRRRISEIKIPANIYLFKVSDGNIKKRCEICSNLTTTKKQNDDIDVVFIVKIYQFGYKV